MFPRNIIENMVVRKSYSAEFPSFTGGLVDITTRDFPEKFNLSLSVGLDYNPQANLNDDFLHAEKGDKDWLGMDDGSRAVPDVAVGIDVPRPSQPGKMDTIRMISRAFGKNIEGLRSRSSLGQTYRLALGNNFQIGERQLGIIGTVSYKKSYDYYDNGLVGQYRALDSTQMQLDYLLDESRGVEDVLWSALLGGSFKINHNNKVGFTLLKNQNGTAGSRYRDGREVYDNNNQIQHIQEYLERSLTAYQLKGKHVIPALNNGFVDWQGSFTRSTQYEPDLRIFVSQYFYASDGTRVDQLYTNQDPERRYRELLEDNYDLKTNLDVPVELFGQKAKFVLGASYVNKHRSSDEEFYKIRPWGTVPFDGSPNQYLADENIVDENKDGYYYDNDKFSNQQVSYLADEVTTGGFGLFDLLLMDKLRMVAGIRYEHSYSNVENKIDTIEFSRRRQREAYQKTERTDRDLLPSINLTYSLTEIMNIRAGYNRTLARPSFRERAPYAYYDYFTSERIQGNPELLRGLVDNLDLRWEYFFRPGEMLSLSGFYKYFHSPIERYMDQTANETIRYRNGEDAKLYGVELEFRKDLDFVNILRDFQFGTNLTLVQSVVKEDSARVAKARVTVRDFPDERPMYGQAPYMFNAFLFYDNERIGLNANLGFTVSGPKINQISAVQTPDIYEQPVHLLSFNIGKTIGEHISVRLSAKNLLDSEYKKTYTLDGQEYIYRFYKPGREFKITLSYTID
jgi:TonB-dependent receptor